ncbi:MAG TPA: hypothetical protein VNG51_13555 [Ktedonobacteraceae bacterium]|nr:hypothetical protein [Ktedonobacteraceae bacterium]
MVKTVAQGFQVLRQRLEITDLQTSTVSIRQQNVRAAVKKGLIVLDDFLTGSYIRNTMIAPLKEADIDIFVVLDDQYYKSSGQAFILDKVKDVLKETYPTLQISRDGQAVTISFSDFRVDVVPAFIRHTIVWRNGYRIPNTITQQWITTDPQKHVALWSKASKPHHSNLIPLIKMLKGWNKKNGSLLNSFHLECLILKIMKYETIKETAFPTAVRYVFEKARKSFQQVYDPIMNSSVSNYLNTQDKVDAVACQLDLAYGRAKNAEEWVHKKNIEDAYYYWGKLFGDYFPAYG